MCARVILRAATILSILTVVLLACRSQRLSDDRGGVKARPLTARKFERNPERLRRGSYLMNDVAACFTCHDPVDFSKPGTPPVPGKEGSGYDWGRLLLWVTLNVGGTPPS